MKMQTANAPRWFDHLPPMLARAFVGRAVNAHSNEAGEVDAVEIPHSRWTWEEGCERAAEGSQRRLTKRPEIMVPVDFSESSEAAIDYAIKVARRARARLILLHAVHLNLTPYGPANPTRLRSALCREALQKMEGIMARVQRQDVPVISVIEQGAPACVIADAAKRWNADLMVICSRKRSKWARFFGQKILEKVACVVGCPVMAIHSDLKGATT
jgi:nucleotide-binding universal stress UspA family protein